MEIEKTIIKEKRKITTEVKEKAPEGKKATGTRIIQNKDSIILQKL